MVAQPGRSVAAERNRSSTRTVPKRGRLPRGGATVVELSPAARPHPQALNLNPDLNLARLKALEIKSKITIKIKNPTDRPDSPAVRGGPAACNRQPGTDFAIRLAADAIAALPT